ncbi:MAG: radical SAM protein [Thermoguttaceae bacterium]|jgi:cyclic pyranopterin phosphate synthase
MLVDSWGRKIQYLRVSVTDRCNLRCVYCMPEKGISLLPHSAMLSYEEIAEVVRAGVALGISKVRLTGGEPLVRRNLQRLVAMIAPIPGVSDFTLTTNGILLASQARPLAEGGLQRVNISLDTLDPRRYAALTRGGDVQKVLAGIAAAQEAGLTPVKLNCVITPKTLAEDVEALRKFAARENLELRLIPRMNLTQGLFGIVHRGGGGDCRLCNRLRLTCDGWILPCLFGEGGYSVRKLGASEALRRAVAEKPRSGSRCTTRAMQTIGG